MTIQGSYDAVSCPVAGTCVAVGQSTGGQSHALVERFDGTRRAATTGIDPPGTTSAALLGMSCVSARRRTAVGSADGAGMVDGLVRSTWTPILLALPSGAASAALVALSVDRRPPVPTACTTKRRCTVAGYPPGGRRVGRSPRPPRTR